MLPPAGPGVVSPGALGVPRERITFVNTVVKKQPSEAFPSKTYTVHCALWATGFIITHSCGQNLCEIHHNVLESPRLTCWGSSAGGSSTSGSWGNSQRLSSCTWSTEDQWVHKACVSPSDGRQEGSSSNFSLLTTSVLQFTCLNCATQLMQINHLSWLPDFPGLVVTLPVSLGVLLSSPDVGVARCTVPRTQTAL